MRAEEAIVSLGQRNSSGRFEPTIGAEVEAFLAGEYLDYLDALNRDVPAWAWVNPLAHADGEELRAIAVHCRQRRLAPSHRRRWHLLLASLAQRLLAVAERGPHDLGTIQRARLVPLELELAARPTGDRMGPDAVAAEVAFALARPLPET